MWNFLPRYAQWLHLGWPAGRVEPLPQCDEDGRTGVRGLYIAGDLSGVPLLKLSALGALRSLAAIEAELARQPVLPGVERLVILGAGIAGSAAALEAQRRGIPFVWIEAARPLATIADFPARKPIYAYPKELEVQTPLPLSAGVKEQLLHELEAALQKAQLQPRIARAHAVQHRAGGVLEVEIEGGAALRAQCVLVAIGRSGDFRRLGVSGEELPKVHHRLLDAATAKGQRVAVVGGGDSAVEAALALCAEGAQVDLIHRGAELSRPKHENREQLEAQARSGALRVHLGNTVEAIEEHSIQLRARTGEQQSLANDAVYVLIGREAPLAFLRRSGVSIVGERTAKFWLGLALFTLLCVLLYNWKAGGALQQAFRERQWFPFAIPSALSGEWTSALGQTMRITLGEPGFYYSLAYCLCVTIFGIDRILRRRTDYIRRQTLTLMAVQWLPLFCLPYLLLPWLGAMGFWEQGAARSVADALFPITEGGHGREYWRAFGLVLAWPLFIWNVFTDAPLWTWLVISLLQTFVLIPLLVWKWGKGAYCGWICSCGALAETLGDRHRHKMPHGPAWNRLNLVGQVILACAVLLFVLRVISWTWPGTWAGQCYSGLLSGWSLAGVQLNYYWIVDVGLAGIVGVAAYFWFSGRVWCRFACPLAALMHIYARFSRFRIFADKRKCISCNVCTSVCHQGIDVMAFASRGAAMADPQCVRCSACVSSCPTGVLEFGALPAGATLKNTTAPTSGAGS